MLGSSIILVLSTCAFALNARYEREYAYGYEGFNSTSLSTSCTERPSYTPPPALRDISYVSSPSASSYFSSATRPNGYGPSSSKIPYPINNGTQTSTSAKPGPTGTPSGCAPYWLENIKHQGLASFNLNVTSYKIFRNVKDFGAKGDGLADDTAAIQRAITEGNRCTPGFCESTTTTPAIVYFPGGTYVISASLIDYYYTQIIGNPNCMPVIQASANFSTTGGLGLIDGSPYQGSGPRQGKTGYGATNTFFRQIRNLILDMTKIPANVTARGIHWPTAQTTSLQNVVFDMNAENGTQHEGLFVEEGSGGFMTDLVFNGGNNGFNVGNQQFTTRNLTFNNVNTAINQLWDWGWTYAGLKINNCRVGLNMSSGGPSALTVGSITLFDSEINNTPIGVVTGRTDSSEPDAVGSLYLENVKLDNVGVAVLGPSGPYLAGSAGSTTVAAWADGHRYLPTGPNEARGPIDPSNRPAALTVPGGSYYARSKPQYGSTTLSSFLSARDLGCAGDGVTDDTEALNAAILKGQAEKKILFIDAGYYRVTDTIYVPAGSMIVGEALASVILANGPNFEDINAPKAVVMVGMRGEQGAVELSDLFMSTKGPQAGAILMEYNLYTTETEPSGLWDVHTRIGGFAGSDLQSAQCVKSPDIKITESNLQQNCIAAYMSIHVTKWASGLYMENNWLWTADHDLDDPTNNNTQITIYAGRGLLVESLQGRIWLYGTAVEHHVKYEYQFVSTRNIFMGQIQTETAYYQPNPDATIPFPYNAELSDPQFTPSSNNSSINAASGWGLRIVSSNNIFGYGVGLYSFFDNYSTNCSAIGAGARCQSRILSIEGEAGSYDINLYNLNTVGATQMVTRDGEDLASNVDNNSTFVDTVNVFRIDTQGQ